MSHDSTPCSKDVSHCESQHFTDYRAFLDAIQPYRRRWCDDELHVCDWVFRGQGNAAWTLTPSAWRSSTRASPRILCTSSPLVRDYAKAMLKQFNKYKTNPTRQEHFYELALNTKAEIQAIEEFASLVDELGFPVPSQSSTHVQQWAEAYNVGERSLIGEIKPELVALAQHHGIPTRLLDFTRRSLVAAFFACEQWMQFADEKPAAMAVWAINLRELSREFCRVQPIRVPRYQMSYLHAQDALFLLDTEAADKFLESGKWRPLEEALFESANTREDAPACLVRKLSLAASEVPKLMKCLRQMQISRAHMMPTLDNVTETLRAHWNMPPQSVNE